MKETKTVTVQVFTCDHCGETCSHGVYHAAPSDSDELDFCSERHREIYMRPLETNLFSFTTHKRENNKQSEGILKKNKEYFSERMLQSFDLLMTGIEVTVLSAILQKPIGISSWPRRVADLREMGVSIQDKWYEPEGKPPYMAWFMDQYDIDFNKKFKTCEYRYKQNADTCTSTPINEL